MTTPVPYDPVPARPPMPAYSTAPPWAQPPPAAPPADTPPMPHGQLMVAYPDLMDRAGRPAAPSWVPVAVVSVVLSVAGVTAATGVCTILFGVPAGVLLGAAGGSLGLLGAIPAVRRGRQARRDGNPRYPYWLAFGLALVAAAVPGLVALNVTERIVQADVVEPASTRALQSGIVHDGKIKTAYGVSVQSAKCTPDGTRASNGYRPYSCVVGLSSGQPGTIRVLADRKGDWVLPKK